MIPQRERQHFFYIIVTAQQIFSEPFSQRFHTSLQICHKNIQFDHLFKFDVNKNFPKTLITSRVNHHHPRCLQIALSVVCMGWAGKEVLWSRGSDLDKTARLYHALPGCGGWGGFTTQGREWAYTTCPGFRVYRDTRSRGVNLQFSVKCALKGEFDDWSLSVHCWIHQTGQHQCALVWKIW